MTVHSLLPVAMASSCPADGLRGHMFSAELDAAFAAIGVGSGDRDVAVRGALLPSTAAAPLVLPEWRTAAPQPRPTPRVIIATETSATAATPHLEKNWIAFEFADAAHYIYSLHPFVVVRQDVDGSLTEVTRVTDARLEKSVQRHGTAVHGGANAVAVAATADKPAHFVAAFHTVNADGRYQNYVFEFAVDIDAAAGASGPASFKLGRISAPVPLVEANTGDASIKYPLAFLSGLAWLPPPRDVSAVAADAASDDATLWDAGDAADYLGRWLLAYGSSNMQSRVLALPPAAMEQLMAAGV